MNNPYWYFIPNNNYQRYYSNTPYTNPNYNSFRYKNMQNPQKSEKYCDYFNLGDKAPEFTLDAIVNGQPTKVSLSDYLGQWVVLFFYGSDFTFV